MKLFVFLCVALFQVATFANMPQLHLFNSLDVDADTQLYQFAVGKWQLKDGACVSGHPVYWGGDFKSFSMHVEFNANLIFEMKMLKSGVVAATSNGSFGINDRTLYLRTMESYSYENNSNLCSGQNPPQVSSALMSIQDQELWLLSNQGANGGSCPAQDIFIMKFSRE